jgi:hypothetical protein
MPLPAKIVQYFPPIVAEWRTATCLKAKCGLKVEKSCG